MAVTAERHREWNDAITAALLDGFPLLQEAVIGFYWPFKGEFDPRFAIHGFRSSGARAELPVVTQKNAPLQFREWWPGVGTTKGVFDLPVPEGTGTLKPQALLIPPIGFDAGGYRLGYGGGYFDRARVHALACAIAAQRNWTFSGVMSQARTDTGGEAQFARDNVFSRCYARGIEPGDADA